MSDQDIKKGLAGVVVDTSSISRVDPATQSLTYRGYPVEQLCESTTFEQVAWLLWHGELPTDEDLAQLEKRERELRTLDQALVDVIAGHPKDCHPMDVCRTAVSWIGAQNPHEDDRTPEAQLAASLDLLAKMPTVVAFDQRRRRGLDMIQPDPELGYCENFLAMTFGEAPTPETVRAFNTSMILYAEHSFNASTFAARVITSTESDLYSAVTGGIGALKGPLHGGANEEVMHMLNEIGDGDPVAWLDEALAEKRKIMGFGHRVYKNGDSRVPTMDAALRELTDDGKAGEKYTHMVEQYDKLQRAMLDSKNIYPNVDYPTGLVYDLMGFDIEMFTPLFVMSRITGWTAHIMEQSANNALIRPLPSYDGVERREVPGH